MKIINGFLDMMGFENTQDFLGSGLNPQAVAAYSIAFGSLGAFVEAWTGISLLLWVFLTLGSIFDVAFGVYANVVFLKHEFESKRFFRGVFKSFVVLFIILITNSLNLGVTHSNIHPDFLKTTFVYITNTIHYSFVMLIALYLLAGISENGAKLNIPVFKSVTKILKMKINRVENVGENYIGNLKENITPDTGEISEEENDQSV